MRDKSTSTAFSTRSAKHTQENQLHLSAAVICFEIYFAMRMLTDNTSRPHSDASTAKGRFSYSKGESRTHESVTDSEARLKTLRLTIFCRLRCRISTKLPFRYTRDCSTPSDPGWCVACGGGRFIERLFITRCTLPSQCCCFDILLAALG